jgi:hypothetical protein
MLAAGRGKPGRSLSYVAKVQFNGNLLVGKAYTAQLGLEPGDEFEIKLGRKQIKLIPSYSQHGWLTRFTSGFSSHRPQPHGLALGFG